MDFQNLHSGKDFCTVPADIKEALHHAQVECLSKTTGPREKSHLVAGFCHKFIDQLSFIDIVTIFADKIIKDICSNRDQFVRANCLLS